MQPVLKKFLYASLRNAGIYNLSRWLHRKQAVILTYHGVLSQGEDNYANRNSITAAQFDEQMAFVSENYHVFSLPELAQRLISNADLPKYSLAITFDDGFKNNGTVAAPILKKYNLPATVFLTTAFVNSPKLGLWTERVDWLLQTAHIPSVEFIINGDLQELSLNTTRDRIIASDLVRGYLKGIPPQQRESAIADLADRGSVLYKKLMKTLKNVMLF